MVVNNDSKVESVTISTGGRVIPSEQLILLVVEFQKGLQNQFNVIIPPNGGHGYDIYRELGIQCTYIYVLKMTLKTLILSLETSLQGWIGRKSTAYSSSTVLNLDKADSHCIETYWSWIQFTTFKLTIM